MARTGADQRQLPWPSVSGLVWTNAFLRKWIIESGSNPRILQKVLDLARNSDRNSSSAKKFCRSSLVPRRLQAPPLEAMNHVEIFKGLAPRGAPSELVQLVQNISAMMVGGNENPN